MTETINKSNIPVVIFVGGYGSRLKEETVDKPKPMITVGGYPILWHIMKIYSHYGFNKFILTLGYRGDYIRDFLKNDKEMLFSGFDVDLVDTGSDTPTGGRLLKVASLIKTENFFCTYGDGVSDINIADLLKTHLKHRGIVGTVTGIRIPHKFGILTFSNSGKLQSYQKGHLMKEYVNAGFMVLTKAYLKYLSDNMMVEEPFNDLGQMGKMAVYRHEGYFGAVDTLKELMDLNKAWEEKPKWKVW